jgi:hypothetical protein
MVHPAYSQIIRQLDVSEVELLSIVLSQEVVPVVVLTHQTPGDEGQYRLVRNLMNTYRGGKRWVIPEAESWVNNWVRLGLVEVDYANFLTDPRGYSWVDGRPEMESHKQIAGAGSIVDFEKGFLRRTAFGENFAAAVMPLGRTPSDVQILLGAPPSEVVAEAPAT